MKKLDNHMMDELLMGSISETGVNVPYAQLLQRMVNSSLEAEFDVHLRYGKGKRSQVGFRRANTRNGKTHKLVKSEFGNLLVETPRDRDGSFRPQLVTKRQTRLVGVDRKILTLYAEDMSADDFEDTVRRLYRRSAADFLTARVTDAVRAEAKAWQTRQLESIYPTVWLDDILVKSLAAEQTSPIHAHIILAVNLRGEKDILGIRLAEHDDGSKLWLSTFTELRNRGVQEIYVACMDGVNCPPETLKAVLPKTVTICSCHSQLNPHGYGFSPANLA